MELGAAASWLETLGYVHGDIRPPNLLLDSQEHLKLADFDCVAPIGAPAETTTTPWIQLLGPEAGEHRGTFRLCGAQTEQFAIGSILYCLTRGYEPYEMDELEDITEPLHSGFSSEWSFPVRVAIALIRLSRSVGEGISVL